MRDDRFCEGRVDRVDPLGSSLGTSENERAEILSDAAKCVAYIVLALALDDMFDVAARDSARYDSRADLPLRLDEIGYEHPSVCQEDRIHRQAVQGFEE